MNKRVYLFQADAEHLPCKNETFTQVICSEVLEHLLDPSAALNEMVRILKREGVAIISIPNESMINLFKSILIRLGIFKWLFQWKGNYQEMPERMEDEWHLHVFKLNDWLDLFRNIIPGDSSEKNSFLLAPLGYVVRLERTDPFEEMK